MTPIRIGMNADGDLLDLAPEIREGTHMHIIGGSGTGKSKFLEWMIREDLREGHGLCLIDWHGTLYSDVLRYCAYQDIGLPGDYRSIILLDPSQPHFVTGFNPFASTTGDVSVQVSRRIDATIRPWGVTDTNETPTFARVCRILYTFMIENHETLPNAAQLLHFKNRELRGWAARSVRDHFIRGEWEELQQIKQMKEWKDEVLSTKNRLVRFVGSTAVRRFMGLSHGNIDLMEVMDNNKILLVNLGFSDFLDREAARVFASLFLNEFFETAMRRASRSAAGEKPTTFVLYLDEFQEYMTDDVSAMLDQVRKGGLHMVLAHQHLGHFAANPKLKKSVFTNARIRAVFGGLDYEDACMIGNEMFLPDLNARQIAKAYYHTIHLYREEIRTAKGQASGRSTGSISGSALGSVDALGFGSITHPELEGWSGGVSESSSSIHSELFSKSHAEASSESEIVSETEFPVWVPIPTQELGSEVEWKREEKLSKVAETLRCQQQRHCFIKLDREKTQPLRVPDVWEPGVEPETLLEYEHAVYKTQGALPAPEIDRLIEENEQRFLAEAGCGGGLKQKKEPSDEDFLE